MKHIAILMIGMTLLGGCFKKKEKVLIEKIDWQEAISLAQSVERCEASSSTEAELRKCAGDFDSKYKKCVIDLYVQNQGKKDTWVKARLPCFMSYTNAKDSAMGLVKIGAMKMMTGGIL